MKIYKHKLETAGSFKFPYNIGIFEDEKFFLVKFDFCSPELRKKNFVSYFYRQGDNFAIVVIGTRSSFKHNSIVKAIRLLENDSRFSFCLWLYFADDDSVEERKDSLEVA